MYDDKLDGLIDEKMYLDKVKDYKTRQAEIIDQMARHEKADHNFYVTTNLVMNLAARASEIFESSEADEKRQLLNLVYQNLKLDGKNLLIQTSEPFSVSLGITAVRGLMKNMHANSEYRKIKIRCLDVT